jgi:hypothetical protein
MTPKEKANKLRYQIESAMQNADMRGHYNQAVKECALIAVDEVLDAHLFDLDERAYYQEVKQEIERL